MLKIVASMFEIQNAGTASWYLVDDSTGEHIGIINPVDLEALTAILEKQGENILEEIGVKEIKDEEQTSMENAEIGEKKPKKSEPKNESLRIPLTEKRFLDITEFQEYTSLGKNRAAELARTAGCIFRFGRRKMIDRIKFDKWCDAQ